MAELSPRLQRVADMIQRELAVLIQLEIRDPRVGMVSVTGVDISRDMAHANVFVTVLGAGTVIDEADKEEAASRAEEINECVKALNKASGFLRSLLAKRLKLRSTPKLQFRYDNSIARGQYLSSLIDDAIESDRKLSS